MSEVRRSAKQGFDWYQGAQNEDILMAFPAQELVQIIFGEPCSTDWPAKWLAAGGQLYNHRMIASKNDPVWIRISDSSLPYPPFDEYDIMGVRDISYTEAKSFGLDINQKPQLRDWAEDEKLIRRRRK